MQKYRTGILVILDGFGVNPNPDHNAVYHAKMPAFKELWEKSPHTTLEASESFVGLPKGFMGNSEVGHLNIGAGRIVFQDFSLISRAIEDGSFFKNEHFLRVIEKVKKSKGALHLFGLLSDGGVHSHYSHLFALLELAKKNSIQEVWIHAFMDGRDTSPTDGVRYLEETRKEIQRIGVGKIATVIGRFYAMDRDKRWERTELAYQSIVEGKSENGFSDPVSYVKESYKKNVTDEFILPGVSKEYSGIKNNDGVIFYNFRADRARQITRACTVEAFNDFKRGKFPKLSEFLTMTPYDKTLPTQSAYEKPVVPNTLGEIISGLNGKQLRIAETEKYAHVTYFFNGGDEKVYPGEKRILVPSPREVKTYDLKPEMSAVEVTRLLLEELSKDQYQFVCLNFANPDMVGHTGNFKAAVSALETVDLCLKKILDWAKAHDAFLLLTADHGNCEKMQDESGAVLTSHTLLPVPLILFNSKKEGIKLSSGGRLCDIAPTLLEVWGIPKPAEMTGKSLITH